MCLLSIQCMCLRHPYLSESSLCSVTIVAHCNKCEISIAGKRFTQSEQGTMQEWITKMVPASSEPLGDSLTMPITELTLARLPETGATQNPAHCSGAAQISDVRGVKDDEEADGISCSLSGLNGAAWHRPEVESIFRMRTHSSQSHSDCDVCLLYTSPSPRD